MLQAICALFLVGLICFCVIQLLNFIFSWFRVNQDLKPGAYEQGWKGNVYQLNRGRKYNYNCDICSYATNTRQAQEISARNISSPYTSILTLHELFEDEYDARKLGVMHINMQTLSKNSQNFNTLVTNLCLLKRPPDIICITETRFRQDQNLQEYQIPTYTLFARSRSTKIHTGGGVAIYMKDHFKFVELREDLSYFEKQVFESLFLEIHTQVPNFRLVCGVVYRTNLKKNDKEIQNQANNEVRQQHISLQQLQFLVLFSFACILFLSAFAVPFLIIVGIVLCFVQSGNHNKTPLERFLEQLEKNVSQIKKEGSVGCICGDFNQPFDLMHVDKKKSYLSDFKQIMYKNDFFSCINRPTRFSFNKKSETSTSKLIDQIWCNNSTYFFDSAILVDPFADHLAVCCSLKTNQPHFDEANLNKLLDVPRKRNTYQTKLCESQGWSYSSSTKNRASSNDHCTKHDSNADIFNRESAHTIPKSSAEKNEHCSRPSSTERNGGKQIQYSFHERTLNVYTNFLVRPCSESMAYWKALKDSKDFRSRNKKICNYVLGQ